MARLAVLHAIDVVSATQTVGTEDAFIASVRPLRSVRELGHDAFHGRQTGRVEPAI
ncbi:MAG: hypothetical protein WBF17_20725 [Phycisphaerae bacterium]